MQQHNVRCAIWFDNVKPFWESMSFPLLSTSFSCNILRLYFTKNNFLTHKALVTFMLKKHKKRTEHNMQPTLGASTNEINHENLTKLTANKCHK